MENRNKTALITGAGRGIGKRIALVLAARGFDCALNDLNAEDLETAKTEVEALGRRCGVYRADVSSPEQVDAMVKQVLADLGGVDVLVNNAGITRDDLLMRMKEADWDLVMTVNLKSVFNCTKAVTKPMMKQRGGRIISISSVVGVMGNAGQSNYSASKAGIIGFTKSVAKELASRGITANAVAPGFIQTEMTDRLSADVKERLYEQIPLGKLGTADDVARAVAFLASDDAAYITGQVLHVDGGMVM